MKNVTCKEFIEKLPKAELHVHIEGTMEPAHMVQLAKRNNVKLPVGILNYDQTAYVFSDFDSFINVYIQATKVLRVEQDFYDLTWAYLEKIAGQGVLHTEIFFDLQTYMPRHISPAIIINGMHQALCDGQKQFGITGSLIMCIIRHLSEEDGFKVLALASQFKDKIIGIGLASTENGNPPSKFERVFAKAKSEGFHVVAHVAEGDSGGDMIRQALSLLGAERIDHGIGCIDDPVLMHELALKKIPLTVCPLSNLRLGYFKKQEDHPLKKMFDAGLMTTINSDDPAFFDGYIADNYRIARDILGMSCQNLITCAQYSFQASFISETHKKEYLAKLDNYRATHYCCS